MDLDYWGFRRWPFERSFAADRFFFSPLHEEALARLLFLVEEFRRVGVLVGPTGTGKTYLLKLLHHRAERLGRLTVCCEATGADGNELISQIAMGCLVPCDSDASVARMWSGLRAKFAALTLIQQSLVIIVDHVDLDESSCRQTVRRLRQLADSTGLKLTIILATNTREIPEVLHDVIELRIDLGPWTLEESSQFMTRAVSQAGVSQGVFTDEAMNSIHQFTCGIPANVVALCNLTLLAAMGRDEKLVTSEIVEAASQELPSINGSSSIDHRLSTTKSSLALNF